MSHPCGCDFVIDVETGRVCGAPIECPDGCETYDEHYAGDPHYCRAHDGMAERATAFRLAFLACLFELRRPERDPGVTPFRMGRRET